MERDYKKLFQKLPTPELSNGLGQKILQAIETRQKKKARLRFMLFLSLFLGSLLALIWAGIHLYEEFVQSGAFNFVALLFEHFSDAWVSGQDFLFSLLEYLPMFSITIFFMTIFGLLFSLRFLFKDFKKILTHRTQFFIF